MPHGPDEANNLPTATTDKNHVVISIASDDSHAWSFTSTPGARACAGSVSRLVRRVSQPYEPPRQLDNQWSQIAANLVSAYHK